MNRLFWGLLFVALDFELNPGSVTIGLLPDFIGWYLLMKGMEALAEENRYFDRGRHWAFALCLLNVVLYGADLLNPSGMNAFAMWMLGLAGLCVGVYVTGSMIRGIRQMEEDHHRQLHSEKLKIMWMIQAVMGILAHLFSWLPLVGEFTAAAAVVTAVCLLIAMYGTAKCYEEREK